MIILYYIYPDKNIYQLSSAYNENDYKELFMCSKNIFRKLYPNSVTELEVKIMNNMRMRMHMTYINTLLYQTFYICIRVV